MNDKRVLLAAALSAIFLTWYSQTIMRQMRQPGIQPTQQLPRAFPQASQETMSIYHIVQEDVTYIESDGLKLEIGEKSGSIRHAELKNFLDATGKTPLKIGSELPLLQILPGNAALSWRAIETGQDSVTLEATNSEGNNYHITYSINNSNNLINIELEQLKGTIDNTDIMIINALTRADQLTSRQNILEAVTVSEGRHGELKHQRHLGQGRSEKIVPRGTSLLSLSERYFCESIKPIGQTASVKILISPANWIVTEGRLKLMSQAGSGARATITVYVGPRDYFYLKRAGFESAFPIGILGKIGLIMLTFLGWLAGLVGNYGLAIIIFSGVVTGLMSPFTLLGFRSMKKMQSLKPQIDRIMAKQKDDPQRSNRELFALYKTHKVSPLSGCLPMFIQFPVFIALFQAISHYVELRGRSFLWIKDLSLPDHMAKLPFSVPILGEHLNALPVIMAAAMYVQTKMSQASMAIDPNNPSAKMMSGPMMSVLFGVMFYQFPSGLVLYWLTNSLFSLAVYKASMTTS